MFSSKVPCQFYNYVKAIALLALALSGVSANAEQKKSVVDLPNVAKHIEVLASDAFQGRGPLTEGEQLTINYLAEQYQAIGLQGANPNNGQSSPLGRYLQAVPMAKITPNQDMTLQIGNLSFASGSDFTARTEQIDPQITLNDSALVFVGPT